MHALTEIVYGLAGRAAVRVRPRAGGVSLVPVDLPGLTAADFARAARATLSRRRRQVASTTIPKVQITLENAQGQLLVADDRGRDVRAIKILRNSDGARMATEADTSSLADDIQLQALLAHVAIAFDVELVEDVGPALATILRTPGSKEATPKEQAMLRAHERLRKQALEIRRLDTAQRAPMLPMQQTVIVLVAALAIMILAGLTLPQSIRGWAMPLVSLAVIGGLGALAWTAYKKAGSTVSLEAARTRASQAREAAREELHELAETLAKRGADSDEVLGRFSSAILPPGQPAILSKESFTSADMQLLADLGRPAIVFVDKRGLLFAEDYAEALVALEHATPE